jgi:hypothetical protein
MFQLKVVDLNDINILSYILPYLLIIHFLRHLICFTQSDQSATKLNPLTNCSIDSNTKFHKNLWCSFGNVNRHNLPSTFMCFVQKPYIISIKFVYQISIIVQVMSDFIYIYIYIYTHTFLFSSEVQQQTLFSDITSNYVSMYIHLNGYEFPIEQDYII